jgi:prepilin-type N-terminal cleavage/methylation domain-containing protein
MGFTLIEMIIVIAIMAVLSGLGIATSRELLPRFRTRQAARDFSNALQNARIQAIQNNRQTRVRITDYDTTATSTGGANAGAWIAEIGNKKMGSSTWSTLDFSKYDLSKTGEDYLKGVSLSYASADLSGPSRCSCTDSIVYSPLGRVLNPVADFENDGYIRLTFVNKSHNHLASKDYYYVHVYRAGMARVDPTQGDLYSADAGGTASKSTQ